LHSESPHTDPAGRIASARALTRCAKTRHVMHDYGYGLINKRAERAGESRRSESSVGIATGLQCDGQQ
jgi:hypothetical protein